MAPALLSDEVRDRINDFIGGLPVVTAQELDDEDSCPVCLTSFSSILMNPAEAGVTKLVACNHIFCRKDLTQWITSGHGNCPACRDTFLDIRPPSESDDESSDGGEYIPEDDEDAWLDADDFSDAVEYQSDDMDTDTFEYRDTDMSDYMDDEDDWGITDGESSNAEDADAAIEFGEEPVDVNHAELGDVLADEHGDRMRSAQGCSGLNKEQEAIVMNESGLGDVLIDERQAEDEL